MKKLLLKVLALVVVLVVVVVGAFATAFMGNAPTEAGQTFAEGRVITVLDGFVSCFLVRTSSGKWVLIDACMDAEAKAVKSALAAANASPDDVGLILLTHGHGDHTGGVAAFPNAEVRALATEQGLLEGTAAPSSPMGRMSGAKDTGIRVKQWLKDGETVSFGGTDVEVFAVPGHTAGSAAFLADGVLFFGDSARMSSDGAMKAAPWIFSDDTTANGRALVALYNRLSRRPDDVKTMAFAHTGPGSGIAALKAYNP